MELHNLFTVINIFSLSIILIQSLLIINRMTPSTSHTLRSAYVFIGFGAFGGLLTPENFSIASLLMTWAIAYLISILKPEVKDITGVHKALFF
jgi:hypothetical protein